MDNLNNALVTDFSCSVCNGNHRVESGVENIGIGNEFLKCTDKFCNLEDMTCADVEQELDLQ